MSDHFRPYLHFTPPHGWNNDPNGLVYFKGEWHLFYQYFEPMEADGMQWGHAVSKNLLSWEHLPPVLQPDGLGQIWSGSSVVDAHNSSGLFDGRPGIVSLFTYWNPADGWQSQGLAYSQDGRVFKKFAGNPVVPQLRNIPGQPEDKEFRDPKVFWHEASGRWIMAVAGGKLRIFSSADLIHWRFESVSEEIQTECPDLFELPVDGNPNCTRWVLAGSGQWYWLGDFDGRTFVPRSERLPMTYGPDCYAAQTWSDAPDGRRIAIAWLFGGRYQCGPRPGRIQNTFPTSWAGGGMTLPYELTLQTTPAGIRLRQVPVRELESMRTGTGADLNIVFEGGNPIELANVNDGVLDIELEFETIGQPDMVLHIPSAHGGEYRLLLCPSERRLVLDRRHSGLTGVEAFLDQYEAPLLPGADGVARVRVIIDRSSLEVCGADGLVHFPAIIFPASSGTPTLVAKSGRCRVRAFWMATIGILCTTMALSAQTNHPTQPTLACHFRGQLADVAWCASADRPKRDDLDLRALARAGLNYLRGNPDPARNYECKFSLGPLGIPAHVPLLPQNTYGFDPIALGDTDCRMDWQYPHMREMAGVPEPDAVERGVRQRIRGYRREDQLVWMNPAAWVGPLKSPSAVEALRHEWAFTWATGKLLVSLAEEYQRTGDAALKSECRAMFLALARLACRDDQGRAYLPFGAAPWRDGEWLHLSDAGANQGWGGELAHGYPFVIEPLVRYWECTGDAEALALARAFAEGHMAGVPPHLGEERIDPVTGAFRKHVHLHTHEIWGAAHLGAVTGEARYLNWAERAYRFVLSQGTDFGWYPEYIPQSEYRTEICVVGDMTSIAACLARGGRPEFWDHVERTVRNELHRAQFALTPAFMALFRSLHKDKPAAQVEAALAALRKLEGGFVAQPAFDDWVSYPGPNLGAPGLYANGIQMMGCCPPEGLRGLWEAWQGIVQERPEGTFINLAFSGEHAAATVVAYEPADGCLDVQVRRAGAYFLRPPAWAERAAVKLYRDDAGSSVAWGGPANAYVICRAARTGERLRLRWPVPQFTQVFRPQSVPHRSEKLTVYWRGNQVLKVEPRGRHLPMFGNAPTGDGTVRVTDPLAD